MVNVSQLFCFQRKKEQEMETKKKKKEEKVSFGEHSGQTSEICKSQAKYFKVKVATFTIESLRYYQHPVSSLNFLKVY